MSSTSPFLLAVLVAAVFAVVGIVGLLEMLRPDRFTVQRRVPKSRLLPGPEKGSQ